MHPERFRPPLTLRGRHVELVPLERSHAPGLLHAARDPAVSQFLVYPVGPSLAEVERLVTALLERQAAGTDLAFATRLREDGTVVGMTRFLHIDAENDSVEIGGTFLDSAYWRTPLNTDAKLTMLRYAFEPAAVHRVWLQTDLRNARSQAAIARLGASREGVHREDRRLPNGYYRSSVVYSVLASEWPAVAARLEGALQRPWRAGPTERLPP
ncbi:MAG TPA: GNAT family protein [Thermoplasmata archaeon]|nr:GNAT family protein [Thermoplasmata archaeon]